ncbi:YdcF family protein [Alteromonas sp. H39]|uniref:YdcF family protein n=1 Tax=Alteromonas sp. H39 TaxID=3389876 RepID=UPI0039E1109F
MLVMEILKFIAIQLASPLALSFLFAAIAAIFFKLKKRKASKTAAVLSATILFLFSQPMVADLILYPLENAEPSKIFNADKQKPDYILVLACYYNTKGNIPEVSRFTECSLQRLAQAFLTHKKTGAPIIVSGGRFLSDDDIVYAEKAADMLRNLGVDANNLTIVGEGTTTQEELHFVETLLSGKSVVIITSATHLFRVDKLMNHSLEYSFLPVDYLTSNQPSFYLTLPSPTAIERSRRAFYEYFAIAKTYLFN